MDLFAPSHLLILLVIILIIFGPSNSAMSAAHWAGDP